MLSLNKNKFFNLLLSNIENIFFYVLIFVGTSGMIFSIFAIGIASSACFYITFFIIVGWFIYRLIRFILREAKQFSNDNEFLALVFLTTAIFLGGLHIVFKTPFKDYSFSYFRKYLIILTIYLYIYLLTFFHAPSFFKKNFAFIGAGLTALCVVSFFAGIGNKYANQTTKNLLSFTFGNPNSAGLVFSILLCSCLYGIVISKGWLKKLFFTPFAIVDIVFLYMTKSRNCILAIVMCLIILFIGLYFFDDKKGSRFKLPMFITILLPIIISVIYMIILTETNLMDSLNFIFGSTGKTANSRDLTWVTGYKLFVDSPIFGNYNLATLNSISNMSGFQNGSLDILVEQGFIPFVLYTICLFVCVNHKLCLIQKLKFKNIAIISLFSFTILSSTFETGLFFGVGCTFIFGFLYITLIDEEIVFKPTQMAKNEEDEYDYITI